MTLDDLIDRHSTPVTIDPGQVERAAADLRNALTHVLRTEQHGPFVVEVSAGATPARPACDNGLNDCMRHHPGYWWQHFGGFPCIGTPGYHPCPHTFGDRRCGAVPL